MKPPVVTGRADVRCRSRLLHGQAATQGEPTAGSRLPQTHGLVIKMTFAQSNELDEGRRHW